MTERHAYEVEGLRDNGEVYTVEILGCQTVAEALVLAQRYADMWQATVNLNRVPFVDTGSAQWSHEQVEFIQQLPPTRSARAS